GVRRHPHVQQRLLLLLPQGQPARAAEDALREGRRLPPELLPRELRDPDEPHGRRLAPAGGAAALAAQHLGTRDGAGTAALPAGEPARARRRRATAAAG